MMPWVIIDGLRIEFESLEGCCVSCQEEQEDNYIGAIDETCCCLHWAEYRGRYQKGVIMLFKIKINNDVVYEIEARSADTAKKLAKTKFKKEFKRTEIKSIEVE
jgi:hypothetical protein